VGFTQFAEPPVPGVLPVEISPKATDDPVVAFGTRAALVVAEE
jgi:hypothetical protein